MCICAQAGKEEVAATDGVEEEAWKVNQEKDSPTTLVSSSDNEDEDVSRVYQVVNKRTFGYIYIYTLTSSLPLSPFLFLT